MTKNGLSQELSTLIFTAVAVFVWVALIFYSSTDASVFSVTTETIVNPCGRVGAWIAGGLLHVFGLGAFFIPFGFLFVAAQCHSKEGFVSGLTSLSGLWVSVMGLTVFFATSFKTWTWSETEFLTGGIFGSWIASPLEFYLNRFGTAIASMLVSLIALVVSTPVSVSRVIQALIRASAQGLGFAAQWTLMHLVYFIARAGVLLGRHSWKWAKKSATAGALTLQEAWKNRSSRTALPAPESVGVAVSDTESALILEQKKTQENKSLKKEVIFTGAQVKDSTPQESLEDELEDHEDSRETASENEVEPETIEPVIEKVDSPKKKEPKSKFKFETKRGKWRLPSLDYLQKVARVEAAIDRDRLTERARIVKDKLGEFGIDGDITAMRVGPVITLYEFKPAPGIRVSKISGLVDDLSMALSAKSVRILAPLPGKSVVGIEIPSDHRESVFLREFFQSGELQNPKLQIPVVMGKDISGNEVFSDLGKMPHLLVSGQTGSGKSVFMNGLICSLLYRFTPDEMRLILVDPKFIEFSFYHDIPHLLLPVVDDPKNASNALKWAVREMERRYRILEAASVKNLQSYNDQVQKMGAEKMAELLQVEAQSQESSGVAMSGGDWIEAFEKDLNGNPVIGKLPYIVIIIDELADLMMTVKKDVEGSIARIAQKARAAGIHLVIATQRPSTDVITGVIKANLPTRVSFRLSSQIDSRTILDSMGAERLLGQGDMLFIPPGSGEMVRLQGAFLTDDELTQITDFLRDQGKPEYRNDILVVEDDEASEQSEFSQMTDPLYDQALEIVRQTKTASASYLQRRLGIGYNRAAKLIESMESKGIVGPSNGAKPREVLM